MAEKIDGWPDEIPDGGGNEQEPQPGTSRLEKAFELIIEGQPHGKGRPRFGNKRAFTDREDLLAENNIKRVWEEAGKPRLEGPIELELTIYVSRAQNHYTSRGVLSSTGKRFPLPHNKKPDVDNALKTIMDALNTLAWKDDVQICVATVRREWSDYPRTKLIAMPIQEQDLFYGQPLSD